MAEGVVAMLIAKLGMALAKEAATFGASLLCREASALKGLFGEIREAKEELESMQAYLQGAERFKETDETTGIFVNKVRGFAFEIEDVVDEFTYKLEDTHGGFAAKMKKRVKHIKAWRRLTLKLQDIKGRLQGADRRKVRYDMRGIEKDDWKSDNSRSAGHPLHLAREEDLVGIKKNKDKLMHHLDDLEQGSKVATVWGMGGVGKTTLVDHVYKAVKMDFDISAWITVSSSYQVEDLLKKIACELGIPVGVTNENRSLIEAIHNRLQGSKYLLILDDVWDVDVWFKIRNVFPTGSIGRLVITTRIQEVALLATKNCTVELAPLQRDYAWQLFCNEAFWKNENRSCPEELENLAQMFLGKCGGLPIAIACVGRLLSCRDPTYCQWESVYKELESQLTNNVIIDVNIVLKVSLENLPTHLKNCFLHCTIFPEDYLFGRKQVIRHWIAAGFINKKGSKTLEEVAEGYLNQLVNRSLLQVADRNPCGRVRRFRMHDIIRFLALAKSEEESFCQFYNGSRPLSTENTRRLSIQGTNMEQLTPLLCAPAPSLRSLHVFQSHLGIDSLEAFLKPFKLLSTLDLRGVRIKRLPKTVFNLFNLRFLGLRDTHIEHLPKEIGRLQNLEVLDAYNAMLSAIPVEVTTLRKLKYLYVVTVPAGADERVLAFDGIQMPKGIGNLTDLLALQLIEANSEVLCQLGCLTKLRTFAIAKVRSGHCADLCAAITKMVHLVHVGIFALDQREVLQLEALCLPPTVLKVDIVAQLDKRFLPQLVSSSSTLINLTDLALCWSKLHEDSFAYLLGLLGLVTLHLNKAYDGKGLHFRATSLPKLKVLGIWDAPNLSRITIEQGAMQNIARLFLRDCPELKDLPHGIEHLKNLEYLKLQDISEELTHKLQRNEDSNEYSEDWMKISHVRWIDIL